jgi:hypothetical protein
MIKLFKSMKRSIYNNVNIEVMKMRVQYDLSVKKQKMYV